MGNAQESFRIFPLRSTKRRTLLQQFGGIAAKTGFECGFSWRNSPASASPAAPSRVTEHFWQSGAQRFRIEIFPQLTGARRTVIRNVGF
jgi:hypothetical protein